MKTSIKTLAMMVLLAFASTSCSKLHSGDTFTVATDSIDFQYEVIVSKMNYVRVSPVAGPNELTGDVVIPSQITYDGDLFVVTQVARNAFSNYTSITSVELPSTLSVIEDGAFQNCTSLKTINTPQPLSTIGAHAFDGCRQLEAFSLMASISTLGEACFKGCAALVDVEFPSSFTSIPNEAFRGCSSLTALDFPSTIMQIGDKAFADCTGIITVNMDRSVQILGDRAFAGCTGIEAITCLTPTPPICSSSTFEEVPADATVTVPMTNVSDYQTAVGWNHFINYIGTY